MGIHPSRFRTKYTAINSVNCHKALQAGRYDNKAGLLTQENITCTERDDFLKAHRHDVRHRAHFQPV